MKKGALGLLNIVLVRPQIPHNTGSIGRLALNFGARLHLIGPLGFSLDAKEVKRAGLDYWPFVDLRQYKDWGEFSNTEDYSSTLRQNVFFLSKFGTKTLLDAQFAKQAHTQPTNSNDNDTTIATTSSTPTSAPSLCDVSFVSISSVPFRQAEQLIRSCTLSLPPSALVFGSETQGLYGLIGEEAMKGHDVVYLPMQNLGHRKNDIPSFNLASSVAMVTWEAWRQQVAMARSLGIDVSAEVRIPHTRDYSQSTDTPATSAQTPPGSTS